MSSPKDPRSASPPPRARAFGEAAKPATSGSPHQRAPVAHGTSDVAIGNSRPLLAGRPSSPKLARGPCVDSGDGSASSSDYRVDSEKIARVKRSSIQLKRNKP